MPKKKLRVCFATEDFYPEFIGGGGIYANYLAQGLSKLGADLTVIAENKKGREEYWRNKIKLILTPFCFGNQVILAALQYSFFILRLSKMHFDILHATQLSGLFFVLLKLKNIGQVVITVHHTYYDMFKSSNSLFKRIFYLPLIFIEKLMYQKAEAILFHNPFERDNFINYYHIQNKNIATIYLGVAQQTIKSKDRIKTRAQIAKKLQIEKGEKIMLYVGRLVKRKKVNTLLKALAILHRRHVKVRGVIIGQGKEMNNLLKIAPPNATFLGFVEDTKPYFLSASIFVLTSVAEGGIALSILEAASFGLPLIISPSVAGFPILEEGENGYIVDPCDEVGLAKRIKQILPKAKKMGQKSRQLSKKFSWEKCTKQTFNFYQRLARKN